MLRRLIVLGIITAALGIQAGAVGADPPTELIVGLDMETSANAPSVYDLEDLPEFESCVEVDTSVDDTFYVDVFVLNADEIIAFYADVEFPADTMQVVESSITHLFGDHPLQNLSMNAYPPFVGPATSPPVTGPEFYAGAVGNADGSGVLARLKGQVEPGEFVIDFAISTDPDEGITLTDALGGHPGDTSVPPDGIFDGPFINLQARIAVDQPDDDGDGISNGCDNCPSTYNPDQSLPPWNVPVGDDDCDSFTGTAEDFVGTDPDVACGVGAWPPDFNDDLYVNMSDVNALRPPVYGSTAPGPPYQARFDLRPNGIIDIFDVNAMRPPIFNLGVPCTP